MFRFHLQSRGANPAADLADGWDNSASELGLAEPSAPAEPAPTDTPAGDAPTDDPAADAGADRAEAVADPPEDADEDLDPLDVLTSRDDEPEGDQPQQRTIEDRFKALSKRARKLERSLKKSLPVQQALREAGVDLRTLMQRHTTLANIEAALDRNPRLRAALFGDAEGDEEPTTRANARGDRGPAADADDPVEYPFDTTDGPGRFVADMDRRVRSSNRDLADRLDRIEKALTGRVNRIEQGVTATQRATVSGQWKTAADAAAKQITDPGVRTVFVDAVNAAARDYLRGEHKLSPQQVVDHYLRALKVSKGQADRASAAARQRVAESNKNLPRRPANGAPASPRSRALPRLADFNRDITRRYGRSGG